MQKMAAANRHFFFGKAVRARSMNMIRSLLLFEWRVDADVVDRHLAVEML
ncbi:hypothetical protein [Caballeronia sp. J97]|nr:hypothetical protein [Caballeronia sp. J97]